MRIASLVPSATEMLFTLGLGDQVVAVTHECDWPPEAATLPHLTRTVIPPGLSAAEIDKVVRDTVAAGRPLYELDAERLEELRPDLIVTQAVCEVCAVSHDDVLALAGQLPGRPRVLSLDPTKLAEVLADLERMGEVADALSAARLIREQAALRLAAVERAVAGAARPSVLALEWLDPPFVAGHWVPEMIALAGGDDAFGRAGEKSRTVEWDALEASPVDLAVVMPCGYDAERSAEEARIYASQIDALHADRVVAVNASAYFSRPGPRLVTGVELLAHLLHPDRVPAPKPTGGREEQMQVEVLAVSAGGGT